MNFSTLFRLEENLNLDKKTLVILRWIAIIGQLAAINLVYFYLELKFPVLIAYSIISIGFIFNLLLHNLNQFLLAFTCEHFKKHKCSKQANKLSATIINTKLPDIYLTDLLISIYS